MRVLYRPLWDGIQASLQDIFAGGFPADKVIQRQLKSNRKWGSNDRRLFAESLYDVIRWWRKLLFVVGQPWPAEDQWTAVPEIHARVVEAWCRLHDVKIDPSIRISGMNESELKTRWLSRDVPRAVAQSLPDWLDQRGAAELGNWADLASALNAPAPVYLRANRLKTRPDQLVAQLRAEQIEARLVEDDCVTLAERRNVFLTKSFAAGNFEVQDLNSQRVARALLVEPGLRVIDACAGAGGKALHLAALMKNQGKIIALDVVEKKLVQLRERSTRAGASCIEARMIDSTKVVKRLKDSADRLLLDVPCSGVGVLRRNPDSKWKLCAEEVERLTQLQSEILMNYCSMCKVGGLMVYATCSIFPSENSKQVERFLSQNETRWIVEDEETLWPTAGAGDGFYFARLKRQS